MPLFEKLETIPMLLAQSFWASSVCPPEKSSFFCDLAGNPALSWVRTLVGILTTVLVAYLVLLLIRRSIKRVVRDLQGDFVSRGLRSLRKRTPKVLLETDQTASLRRVQRAETIGALLRSASAVIIFLVTILAVIKQIGIEVGPFVAGAGLATAALAFGAQNIIRDFLAGFFIVVEDQYGVGDVIEVNEATGVVESVSLRITQLRSADGTVWSIPNGEIKKVGNRSQKWSRAVIEFRLTVDSDIPAAIRVMKHEADSLWHDESYAGVILEEPEIWGPEEIGDKGILLKLAVKTRPLEQWNVARVLRGHVKRALDDADISLFAS